jgi:glutamate dehydrogenase (NADP+)
MLSNLSLNEFIKQIGDRNPGQPEFLQSVSSVMSSIWPVIAANKRYQEYGLLERMVEPDRSISFRVSWVDDRGVTHVNRGYRVQHSATNGPYKGGLRFHPSVDLSVFKFLAFEQCLKNVLTGLPLGGAKGGADFDPKGKSEAEVMRFCQAFVTELYRHIGSDTDIPAGDIGVGMREIGYMTGMYRKLANRSDCVFTGKGVSFGGSLLRPEATGYGVIYIALLMLKELGLDLNGLRVGISGAGNVAQFAIKKAIRLGARVVSVSDSGGTAIDEEGMTEQKLHELMRVKNELRGRVEDYAKNVGVTFNANMKPWSYPMDVAIPCATHNELGLKDAQNLIFNGVRLVVEGANMPVTADAVDLFESHDVLFAPGKASNAGGVATSGLEMTQNAMRTFWSAEEVDEQLLKIMTDIHLSCMEHGLGADGRINYRMGANKAGFIRLADSMLAQGIL